METKIKKDKCSALKSYFCAYDVTFKSSIHISVFPTNLNVP